MSKEKVVLEAINKIMEKKNKEPLQNLDGNISLRDDLEFDSLDLAELTVRIEDETGVDIFEEGIIDKVSEILERLGKNG